MRLTESRKFYNTYKDAIQEIIDDEHADSAVRKAAGDFMSVANAYILQGFDPKNWGGMIGGNLTSGLGRGASVDQQTGGYWGRGVMQNVPFVGDTLDSWTQNALGIGPKQDPAAPQADNLVLKPFNGLDDVDDAPLGSSEGVPSVSAGQSTPQVSGASEDHFGAGGNPWADFDNNGLAIPAPSAPPQPAHDGNGWPK
jgi:hypothetical protein